MNKIILVGRLTRDPELRRMNNGSAVANFAVAVNRNFKNREGNYDADFFNCVAYRNSAEFISKYFKKGNMILVEGRLQNRSYDAQDGTKRYVTEVITENVEFVGGRNENSNSAMNNNFDSYMDAPAPDPMDSMPEYDIPKSDPYENYDKEISLSDNDLPF